LVTVARDPDHSRAKKSGGKGHIVGGGESDSSIESHRSAPAQCTQILIDRGSYSVARLITPSPNWNRSTQHRGQSRSSCSGLPLIGAPFSLPF
jgi:hypothetical protein